MVEKLKVLFVCSRNRWRSPTAEKLFQNSETISARSAGTSSSAVRRLTEGDLDWADAVLVMESHHRDIIRERFGKAGREVPVEVLDIPDNYQFMDPELIGELLAKVHALIPEADS